MAKSTVRMKLLVDTEASRVLYAEASNDCVDFLFSLLSLPVSTVVRLVKQQLGMEGSLASLYESIENLHESYLQPNIGKDTLLDPARIRGGFVPSVPLLPCKDDAPLERRLYGCARCYTRVSFTEGVVCPGCGNRMTRAVECVVGPPAPTTGSESGGFVKGVVTYTVMDDLVVKPMSNISAIALLTKFQFKDLRKLKEVDVDLGKQEAIALLKASLVSKTVLSDVFVKGKAIAVSHEDT